MLFKKEVKSLSVLIIVVVEDDEVVTRPLQTTSCKSGSCTFITSPGFNAKAFSPVLNVMASFSSCSVSSKYLPYLTAWP